MNRSLLTLMLAALALPALAAEPPGTATDTGMPTAVIGSGRIVEDSRALGGFVAIRANCACDLQLKAAKRDRVTVRADDNIAPLIQTRVVSGDRPVLEIEMRPVLWLSPTRIPTLIVEFQTLDDVSMKGSGDLHANRIEGSRFALSMSGSGDARIDALKVEQFAAVLAGSGDLTVAGSADQQAFRVDGSGDVHAARLRGGRVMVAIAGSGDARVNASVSLDATIRGTGDVIYAGSPRVVERIEGPGRVRRRR